MDQLCPFEGVERWQNPLDRPLEEKHQWKENKTMKSITTCTGVSCMAILMALLMTQQVSASGIGSIQWRTPGSVSKTGVSSDPMTVLKTSAMRHIVVQFLQPITEEGRAKLESSDVKLLHYLGGNSYFAITSGGSKAVNAVLSANASAAYDIQVDWKLHPMVANDTWPSYAVFNAPSSALNLSTESATGEVETVAVYIMFHPDVDLFTKARETLARHGGVMQDYMKTVNAFVAWVPRANVRALAAEDAVEWIEPPLPPLKPVNDSNRVITQAAQVQAAPYNLDGTGINVLVYDAGTARATHVDFGGRLTVRDGSEMDDHPTHVCGTVGGSGIASGGLYKGMAPGVTIQSYGLEVSGSGTFLYDNPGDLEHDYDQAINTYGAVVANSSIGTNTANNGFPCSWEGDYSVTDSLIDAIVAGSLGSPMRIVWANGNERGNGSCGSQYHTTAPPACAKNHITVGALNSDDDSMTVFSSWGPTDDGRIKPDISAPGCQNNGDGGVTSCFADSDTAYGSMCGTSMAAPTVTGLCALILQDYKVQFPSTPLPRNSTMKMLLAHNAVDLGNVGPDYKFGFGSVRVKDTIDFMRRKSFFEATIAQGQENVYFVPVSNGTLSLKVTMAWDDPPGAVNTTPELVNDLDLIAIEPNGTTTHYPWTLDPANPSKAAVRTGADHRNNIEQVVVDTPVAGTWLVKVSGHAVAQGPQVFSLGTSPDFYNCTSAGVIVLSRDVYNCSAIARITVNDCDLDKNSSVAETVNVTVKSTTQSGGMSVTLTETGVHTATFTGTVQLSPTAGSGVLRVNNGDTLTAVYLDANDGYGHQNVTVTDTAGIDCQGPIISNIQVTNIESSSATITFNSNETTNGHIRCGSVCGGPYQFTEEDISLGTTHTISLNGLNELTTYYFVVDATDTSENETTSNNGGSCYSFTTLERPDYFTELFSAADNDLSNQTFYFTPDSSLSFYHACRETASSFPIDPTGGTVLSLSDDDFRQVSIGSGRQVWLYGIPYTTFYVGANGYITFGTGDEEYEGTLSNHFNQPRISGLFDDLVPESGGKISWKQLSDCVAVTYENVVSYNASNTCSFQIAMFFDGEITLTYLNIGINGGLAGLSAGTGTPADFAESNLSSYSACDALSVSPNTSFASTGYVGGPFTPASTNYTMTNSGSTALTWTASGTQSWLNVAPTSGSLNPGTPVNITLSLKTSANTLAPGTYSDTVTITNQKTGYSLRRLVKLQVLAIPGEINVTDSISPTTDLALPFSNITVGLSRTEHITVANTDTGHNLVIDQIILNSLYKEDFSDGLAQDWVENPDSAWQIVNQEYNAQSSTEMPMLSMYMGRQWNDSDTKVTMRRSGGIYNTSRLIMRASDDFDADNGSALAVGISGDGEFWVIRFTSGSANWLQHWTYSSYLNTGNTSNVIKVTLSGANISVYFNGSLAWTGIDPSPGTGRIGLGGYSSTDGNTSHYFDDVTVGSSGTLTQINSAISPEQAWYNSHPIEDGNAEIAPSSKDFVQYPWAKLPTISTPAGEETSSVESFQLVNVPTMPHVVLPGTSFTFDVVYAPQTTGLDMGKVYIDSNDSNESRVELTLTGTGIADTMAVTPADAFTSIGIPAGPFTPTGKTYTLTNNGSTTIHWHASNVQSWLTVAPSSGTLLANGTIGVNVTLNANANSLAKGNYSDTVTFTHNENGLTVARNIQLNIGQLPSTPITPTPSNLATGIPIDANLSWDGNGTPESPTTFDVYFGNTNPPTTLLAGNISAQTYDLGVLGYSKTYFWKVWCCQKSVWKTQQAPCGVLPRPPPRCFAW